MSKTSIYNAVPKFIKVIFTLFAVNLGWVLFRSPDTSSAIEYIKVMFGSTNYSPEEIIFTWQYYLNNRLIVLGILGIVSSTWLGKISFIRQWESLDENSSFTASLATTFLLALLLGVSIMILISAGNVPFIYFQF